MRRHKLLCWLIASCLSNVLTSDRVVEAQAPTKDSVVADLAAIKKVGVEAAEYEAAISAAKRLSGQASSNVGEILASMKGGSPLAKNWLRMIAADVADNDPFPRDLLLQFFADRSQDTEARHAAFQMLVANDPDLKSKLLDGAADDPSLPIRYAAIAKILDRAAKAKESNDQEAAQLYRLVVAQGRNPEQLETAAKALDGLGEKIELADELGLIRRWWVIGTFDNTGSANFETVYAPEQAYLKGGHLPAEWLTAEATVVKPTGDVPAATTSLVTSDDSMGMVNVNPAFNKAKDAIVYCYAEFEVPQDVDSVARLGCITASKVWVNGTLAMANEVYHSGTMIDQYLGDCHLVPGVNSVLIKVCQNAQTEPWAQDWQFQFRLTDRFGGAIKPTAIMQPKPSIILE